MTFNFKNNNFNNTSINAKKPNVNDISADNIRNSTTNLSQYFSN